MFLEEMLSQTGQTEAVAPPQLEELFRQLRAVSDMLAEVTEPLPGPSLIYRDHERSEHSAHPSLLGKSPKGSGRGGSIKFRWCCVNPPRMER